MFKKIISVLKKIILPINHGNKLPVPTLQQIITTAHKIKYNPIVNTNFTTNKGNKIVNNAGLQLKEIRTYIAGDDVRMIDPNTSARYNAPYVKIYEAFIEPQAIIAIDLSSSIWHKGSLQICTQIEIATLLTTVLSKAAVNTKIIFFNNKVLPLPPLKQHANLPNYIYTQLTNNIPTIPKQKTNFDALFNYLNFEVKTFSEIYIITDGITTATPMLAKAINILSNKHALQILLLQPNNVFNTKNKGLINVEDAETGAIINVDASNKYVQQYYAQQTQLNYNWWQKQLQNNLCNVTMFNSYNMVTKLQTIFNKQ